MVLLKKLCLPRKAVFSLLLSLLLASGAVARFLVDDASTSESATPSPQTKSQSETKAQQKPQTDTSGIPTDYPRNISATLLTGENNSIQIMWDTHTDAKDSFVVLRSHQLQNTAEVALGSVPIKVVPADKLKVVLDRNLPPGKYYYSIVPKINFDDKNVRLYPGENYITNPVIIHGETEFGDTRTVTAIKAVTIEDRSVLLTWEPITNFNGEYILFRAKSPIDTADKLNTAEPIGRISSQKSRFLDNEITPGRHYYAVACKTIDGVLYSDLKKNTNYTEDAVFVGGTIGVRGMRARIDSSNVFVTWKLSSDSFNKVFYLLRTQARPVSRESLAGAYIVDTVQSSAEKYVERNVPAGKYYYVLAPVNYREEDSFALIPGVNITDPPVLIGGQDAANAELPQKKEEPLKKGGAEQQGTSVLKPEPPVPNTDILSFLEELKDLSRESKAEQKSSASDKNTVITPLPAPGKYDNIEPKFPWEGEAQTIEEKQTDVKKEPEIRTTDRNDKNSPTKKSPSNIDEQKTVRKKIIDAVIAGPFARGEFLESILNLKKALGGSISPADSAKARLFIARSYIELGKYREAIGYLNNSYVKKYFPKESNFWEDYSISRLK